MVRVKNRRWQKLEKSDIPLEKLAQHFEAHNRMKAEMDRAARQGRRMGHPKVTFERRGFKTRYKPIMERLSAGNISRRRAAKELGIGYAGLKRFLDSNFPSG